MKLSTARAIGKDCGLETDAECVNNILLHQLNLFVYEEAAGELVELFMEADKAGVRFSLICGDAIPEGADEKELCLFCRKMTALDVDRKGEKG